MLIPLEIFPQLPVLAAENPVLFSLVLRLCSCDRSGAQSLAPLSSASIGFIHTLHGVGGSKWSPQAARSRAPPLAPSEGNPGSYCRRFSEKPPNPSFLRDFREGRKCAAGRVRTPPPPPASAANRATPARWPRGRRRAPVPASRQPRTGLGSTAGATSSARVTPLVFKGIVPRLFHRS